MPSLTKIFGFAAVALAAFTSATSVQQREPLVDALVDAHVDVLGLVNADVDAAVHVKRDDLLKPGCACAEPGVPSLVGIVADLKVNVKVDVDALLAIKKDTCTYDNIKPIVVSLVAKIDAAAAQIAVLSKYKAEQILFDGKVVVDIKVFAELFASVIISICAALQVCLRLVINVKGDVHALLCLVGVAIARLIHVVCGVVGGLLVDLLAILCIRLKVCFWVFVKLNLVDLFALLKINVSAYINL